MLWKNEPRVFRTLSIIRLNKLPDTLFELLESRWRQGVDELTKVKVWTKLAGTSARTG